MKNLLSLILCAGFTLLATPNTMAYQQVNELKCNSASKLTKADFAANLSHNHQFLLSNKYCINNMAARQSIDKSSLPERTEVRNLIKRYKETYRTLNNANDKIAFVDLFLRKASQAYSITLNDEVTKGEPVKIIFNSLSKNKERVSGYALALFQNELQNNKLSATDLEQLSRLTTNSASQKISDAVKYVLEGSPKKQLTKSEQLIKPSLLSFKEGETDDDEVCDDECQDEEYRDWAEEQADGWGDDIDYWWDENTESGEEWLTIRDNDTGEEWDAYHFTPKSG
ncbi:hypothetical protein SG34_006010 [Thalassomonas viridans]|uniref:Uncharacterized protein n=1 Tax=Thalassomonas viridans TaxID=137584 RepID=A0AAE9Z552_9GAMM|nr:hypothetical protein [Thalassomonas viridans]WDE06472.1 hypothetical protein SG34_006010 [Thalassomonas viridans]